MTSDWKCENAATSLSENHKEGLISHQSPVTSHCSVVDLGLIPYGEAYALQKRVVAARKLGAIDDVSIFCEHPHVITQGRNGKREHLLVGDHLLRQKGVKYFETSRGGDITYHGPGQIVGYPILNLSAIRRDVVWYVRMLEEVMIRATADFGIVAEREAGKTGIWVTEGDEKVSRERTQGSQRKREPEKLGAIGVHISRWVTSHGFAYNVATDLRYFDLIVPCGIAGRKATSLEKLLGRGVESSEVRTRIAFHFGDAFGLNMRPMRREALLSKLRACEEGVAVSA